MPTRRTCARSSPPATSPRDRERVRPAFVTAVAVLIAYNVARGSGAFGPYTDAAAVGLGFAMLARSSSPRSWSPSSRGAGVPRRAPRRGWTDVVRSTGCGRLLCAVRPLAHLTHPRDGVRESRDREHRDERGWHRPARPRLGGRDVHRRARLLLAASPVAPVCSRPWSPTSRRTAPRSSPRGSSFARTGERTRDHALGALPGRRVAPPS
jgi:hypothetical protein